MSHTYVSMLAHCVFSTKERKALLTSDLRPRLFPYMCGIAKENGLKIIGIGGIENHTHFLLSLNSTMSISKAVQLIKGGSSKWVNDTFSPRVPFAWQEGYGAFSISISHKAETLNYIGNQEDHHKRHTFEFEFKSFLKKHWIPYDEEHVLG